MDPTARRFLANLPGIVAVVTLPLAALAAMFLGSTAAGAVAVVGWLLLTPLSAILTDEVFDLADEQSTDAGADDPLDTLRDRYARGEIDEVEFERRVERLLETEDVEVPPGTDPDTGRGAGTLPPEPTTRPGRETEREEG